jgi:uncharacterized protein with HEPN domain
MEFRKRYPEKAWVEAVGRRNTPFQRYFRIDVDLVWPVVADRLPALKRMGQEILATEHPPDSAGTV